MNSYYSQVLKEEIDKIMNKTDSGFIIPECIWTVG